MYGESSLDLVSESSLDLVSVSALDLVSLSALDLFSAGQLDRSRELCDTLTRDSPVTALPGSLFVGTLH